MNTTFVDSWCTEPDHQIHLEVLKTFKRYVMSRLSENLSLIIVKRVSRLNTLVFMFTGGSTMLPGLGERLHKEISTLVNPREPGRVKVISPDDRKYAVWTGSAVLAGLSSFPQMCISVQEYDEMGPDIVHRKCF